MSVLLLRRKLADNLKDWQVLEVPADVSRFRLATSLVSSSGLRSYHQSGWYYVGDTVLYRFIKRLYWPSVVVLYGVIHNAGVDVTNVEAQGPTPRVEDDGGTADGIDLY